MISAANSLLTAITAGNAGAGSQRPATTFDAKAAAAADQKLHDLRDAVTKLKSLGNSAKSVGSDMARQKLDALKQRLKMLLMMGGDPKTVAREAAQIAKEIGQAAKEYAASAGGASAAAEATADVPAAPAEAADPKAPADSDGADPDVVSDVTDGDTAPAAPAAAAADGEGAQKADPAAPNQPGDKAAAKSPAPALGHVGVAASDPVITEAKQLAAQAKAILKAAIARAKLQHPNDPEFRDDQAKMDGADKDIQDAAKAMNAADAASAYSPTGQPAADPPAPSVSVQA